MAPMSGDELLRIRRLAIDTQSLFVSGNLITPRFEEIAKSLPPALRDSVREVDRLRALVEAAYREGLDACKEYIVTKAQWDQVEATWDDSRARLSLGPAPDVDGTLTQEALDAIATRAAARGTVPSTGLYEHDPTELPYRIAKDIE